MDPPVTDIDKKLLLKTYIVRLFARNSLWCAWPGVMGDTRLVGQGRLQGPNRKV